MPCKWAITIDYCYCKQFHSNACSHPSWQGPAECHMVQVNRSQLTVLKLIIPSMCTPCLSHCKWAVHSSQLQALILSTSCLVPQFSHTTREQEIITCQHHVSCRNVQTHRCTECTLNAAVLLYTHREEVVDGALDSLHRGRDKHHTHHLHY